MPEADPARPLAVGDIIHGFANGAFGRDSYDCRKIEAVGPDWIVCRDGNGDMYLASGRRALELCQQNRTPGQSGNEWDGYTGPCCDFGGDSVGLTTWGRS